VSSTPDPGSLLDAAVWPHTFYRTFAGDHGLVQLEDGVHAGLTGAVVAGGTVLPGEVHGDLAVATFLESATPSKYCRYDLTTGALDASFGTNGCAMAPRAYFRAFGIARVPDGYRAIVQEDCSNGCPDAEKAFGLIKLTPEGAVDTSFGTAGIEYSTVMPGVHAVAFAAQSSGDLVVNAYVGLYSMLLMRIHSDGSLDTTFGTGGFVPGANGGDVRVLPDDSIIVQSRYNGIQRIDRYTRDGQPLTGFGTGGSADLQILTGSHFDNEFAERAADIASDGRIVVGFSRRDSASTPERYFVLRLTAAGVLDTTFGQAGIAADLGPQPLITIDGIGFEPDGRIVFGGDSTHGQVIGHLQP
jgi:uncharacterized delta-60 repeat protein